MASTELQTTIDQLGNFFNTIANSEKLIHAARNLTTALPNFANLNEDARNAIESAAEGNGALGALPYLAAIVSLYAESIEGGDEPMELTANHIITHLNKLPDMWELERETLGN